MNSHIREVADTVVSDLEEFGRLILWTVEFRRQAADMRYQIAACKLLILLFLEVKWHITVT